MNRLQNIRLKPLVLCFSFLALSGCAELTDNLQTLQKNIQEFTAPTATDSITQMCQASKQNPVRAKNTYVGQTLPINAKLQRIDDDYLSTLSSGHSYRLMLESEGASIFMSSSNSTKINSLNIGEFVKASGVIDNLSNDYSGCIISLKNASFL